MSQAMNRLGHTAIHIQPTIGGCRRPGRREPTRSCRMAGPRCEHAASAAPAHRFIPWSPHATCKPNSRGANSRLSPDDFDPRSGGFSAASLRFAATRLRHGRANRFAARRCYGLASLRSGDFLAAEFCFLAAPANGVAAEYLPLAYGAACPRGRAGRAKRYSLVLRRQRVAGASRKAELSRDDCRQRRCWLGAVRREEHRDRAQQASSLSSRRGVGAKHVFAFAPLTIHAEQAHRRVGRLRQQHALVRSDRNGRLPGDRLERKPRRAFRAREGSQSPIARPRNVWTCCVISAPIRWSGWLLRRRVTRAASPSIATSGA